MAAAAAVYDALEKQTTKYAKWADDCCLLTSLESWPGSQAS